MYYSDDVHLPLALNRREETERRDAEAIEALTASVKYLKMDDLLALHWAISQYGRAGTDGHQSARDLKLIDADGTYVHRRLPEILTLEVKRRSQSLVSPDQVLVLGSVDNRIRVCQLENGEYCYYDAVGDSPDITYDSFVFIGKGYIYSILGILQHSKTQRCFWVHKDRTVMQPPDVM